MRLQKDEQLRKCTASLLIMSGLMGWLFAGGMPALGQEQVVKKETPAIQDNSFLIEEAYNQEPSVVQHISTFSRMWNCKDWSYTFTQEWPAPWNWRHQFSYTLSGLHSGAFDGTGAGFGDAILNYRYQLIGTGESRLAFAPRLSVLLATGDEGKGRGTGGTGMQTNLPFSVVVNKRLVTHWNLGATFIPHARNADQDRAQSVGYSLGQSIVFLAYPRLNFLLETFANDFQSVVGPGKTEWSRIRYVSPGARWAYNFKSGLQIVPGVAVPVGFGPSGGEKGLFVYLSFEHPFVR
jgi:hypothetical protein